MAMIEESKTEVSIKSPQEIEGSWLSWQGLVKKDAPKELLEGGFRPIEAGNRSIIEIEFSLVRHLKPDFLKKVRQRLGCGKRRRIVLKALGPEGEVIARSSTVAALQEEIDLQIKEWKQGK